MNEHDAPGLTRVGPFDNVELVPGDFVRALARITGLGPAPSQTTPKGRPWPLRPVGAAATMT